MTVKCPISPQANNVFPQHKLQKRKPAEQLGRNRANQTAAEAEVETMWRNCRVQVQVESRRGVGDEVVVECIEFLHRTWFHN